MDGGKIECNNIRCEYSGLKAEPKKEEVKRVRDEQKPREAQRDEPK